jgi:hypothetical protein
VLEQGFDLLPIQAAVQPADLIEGLLMSGHVVPYYGTDRRRGQGQAWGARGTSVLTRV